MSLYTLFSTLPVSGIFLEKNFQGGDSGLPKIEGVCLGNIFFELIIAHLRGGKATFRGAIAPPPPCTLLKTLCVNILFLSGVYTWWVWSVVFLSDL